jgi:hypothetical protein
MAVSARVPERYDRLGVGYQKIRREDPRLASRIQAAQSAAAGPTPAN